MKAAESDMMAKCRELRIATGDDEYAAVAATQDRGERFIKTVVARALESKLSEDEIAASAIKQRVDADLATLEWAVLAERAGTLTLPEEARETAQRQIARLKLVRGANTIEQVDGCFILPEPTEEQVSGGPRIDYRSTVTQTQGSIDRMMARSGMLAKGAAGFDDDVD